LLLAPRLHASEDSIQRHLGGVRLGQWFGTVRKKFGAIGQWPSQEDKKTGLMRYRVERAAAKNLDPNVDVVYLSFDGHSLVEIQLIYDAAYTKTKSSEELAADWSLIYGQPRRGVDGRYAWDDGKTLLRVFDAEVPRGPDKKGVELRTSMQMMESDLLEPAG
jgi:hypothetical protein